MYEEIQFQCKKNNFLWICLYILFLLSFDRSLSFMFVNYFNRKSERRNKEYVRTKRRICRMLRVRIKYSVQFKRFRDICAAHRTLFDLCHAHRAQELSATNKVSFSLAMHTLQSFLFSYN